MSKKRLFDKKQVESCAECRGWDCPHSDIIEEEIRRNLKEFAAEIVYYHDHGFDDVKCFNFDMWLQKALKKRGVKL